MFESLIVSRPTSRFGVHGYAAAIVVHAVLAAAAVATAGPDRTALPVRSFESSLHIFAPPATAASRPEVTQPARALPAPPVLSQGLAAPGIAAPVIVPHAPELSALLGVGTRNEVGGPPTLDLAGERNWGEPLEMDAVDEPVEVIHQPPPRFPPALAGAGIGGRVELEYVVDTTGRTEPGSIRTLAGAHPALEAAARASVLAARYRPARVQGRIVRQLVRQTLSFRPAP